MGDTEIENAWHASDCLGFPSCDGCGYIASDMLWYPGPCPPDDEPHQAARSEHGTLYVWLPAP